MFTVFFRFESDTNNVNVYLYENFRLSFITATVKIFMQSMPAKLSDHPSLLSSGDFFFLKSIKYSCLCGLCIPIRNPLIVN